MKNKIIKEYTNDKTGVSVVTFQNKYGTFSGISICSETDMEKYSKFAGIKYAEIRAEMEYVKTRIKQEKIKLKTIQDLYNDIKYNNLDTSSEAKPYIKRIKLKLRDYTNTLEDYQNLYTYLSGLVSKLDDQRTQILNRPSNKLNKVKDN